MDVSNLLVMRGGVEILSDLNFKIKEGELVGLLGPSGSGKTTLMRSLLGVQRISSGSATLLGHEAGAKQLRTSIGYMAQTVAIYNDLTVSENLRYFTEILGGAPGEVDRVTELVDLTAHSQRLVGTLSGGEHARVSLAVALLGEPKILMLDEPTVGLDPILRRDLWQRFNEIAGTGAMMLVSSHVMDEATRCARLLLLREGRLLFDGTPDELLAQTSCTDFDAAFVRLIEGAP